MKNNISIANDFSKYPGGRYYADGEFSGEKFRDELLIPMINKYDTIEVNLDGTMGYGSSFLEEVFGGLVRKGYSKHDIHKKVNIVSSRKSFTKEIEHHIEVAEQLCKH